MKYLLLLLWAALLFDSTGAMAQQPVERRRGKADELDSLRKIEEAGRDTVIFNATYIRFTNLRLMADSTRTAPLDTSLSRFHLYNMLNQPERPTIGLGNIGLPYRELLFTPRKTIGFDAGFHSLDIYLQTQDSVKYYRARTPYTSLSYVAAGRAEQIFRLIHSQNILPRWNVGANYNRIGADGGYRNQRSNHLNASVFTWYESENRRYNLMANGLFNTLKGAENGGLVNDSVFISKGTLGLDQAEPKLANSSDPTKNYWKQKSFLLRQSYYIGRMDTLGVGSASVVMPTQRVVHTLTYTTDTYGFYKNDPDRFNIFPDVANDRDVVADSTVVKNLRNEFMYSFYLRGKALSFIKNELKLDIGIQHDMYWYNQMNNKLDFRDLAAKAIASYSFSDRLRLNVNLHQLVQGKYAGDYLYDARAYLRLSRYAGRIEIGAYTQNKSPERLFSNSNYFYNNWSYSFDRSKINNASFSYINPVFGLNARAEYYIISNYLYYEGSVFPGLIRPVQLGSNLNMLKLSLEKHSRLGNFYMDNYLVYQKSDRQELLRSPEFYTFNSLYYGRKFFNAVTAHAGFDVRMNSAFTAPSYAINVSQFYNGYPIKFNSYPVVDVWARFALRRANVFVRYDYVNQGLFSKGYYTVNRYPMPGAALKFGVSWSFYD